MTTAQNIIRDIRQGGFTNDDLNAMGEAIRFARAQLSHEVKRSIRVGDTVQFYHSRMGITLKGPVKGVKIKNVIVSTQAGVFRVPANMLELV
jgi:predicted RNA-binding protein with PUA-like domain